jgi:hypothetical protein
MRMTSAAAIYTEAEALRSGGDPTRALDLLAPLLDGGGGEMEPWVLWKARLCAIKCLAAGDDWERVRQLSMAAVAVNPENARAYRHLGEALIHVGDRSAAAEALETSYRLDPVQPDTRSLLAVARDQSTPPPRPTVRPWPSSIKAFRDPSETIRRYILRGRDDPKFIGPDTRFVTLGSCFAKELAKRLEAAGRQVFYEPIGEDVNSTLANRQLLDWIERGEASPHAEAMEGAFGPEMRQRLRAALAAADVVILTLGVAPAHFHHQTGEFVLAAGVMSPTVQAYLKSHHVMRTMTVAENAENLRAAIDVIRRLAQGSPRIVMTVSPVPLQGTTEMASAFEADCLSKSTLRVACQEVLDDPAYSGAVYWPSFEMVRWAGAYWPSGGAMAYGVDDGSSWHVSLWLVDLIVRLFLEHFAVAPADGR